MAYTLTEAATATGLSPFHGLLFLERLHRVFSPALAVLLAPLISMIVFKTRRPHAPGIGVPKTCRFPVPLSLAISKAARPSFERSAKG